MKILQSFCHWWYGIYWSTVNRRFTSEGISVHALTRPDSQAKVPKGALPVIGYALDPATFASAIPLGATLVHLIGAPHPNPAKATEFQ
ncbi:MAG: hypothetical protein V4568_17810 [Pseudomonadota bacterium]